MPAFWQNDNLDIWRGEPYRNRLTIQRVEDDSYSLLSHSATFRLQASASDVDIINQPMAIVTGYPLLAIVNGTANVLVAVFDLVIPALDTALLTPGVAYPYAVHMTDSRGETRLARTGYVYAAEVLP